MVFASSFQKTLMNLIRVKFGIKPGVLKTHWAWHLALQVQQQDLGKQWGQHYIIAVIMAHYQLQSYTSINEQKMQILIAALQILSLRGAHTHEEIPVSRAREGALTGSRKHRTWLEKSQQR
jgi:hypothetical protein